MARLHRRFLGEAGPTDVLAFDLRTGRVRGDRRRGKRSPREARVPFEAEIAIGVEVARREAAARSLPLQREVELYLVHGLLHLAGLDDHRPADRARMRRAESVILSSVGWPVSDGSG
jgi:probable rRNA maturation factor